MMIRLWPLALVASTALWACDDDGAPGGGGGETPSVDAASREDGGALDGALAADGGDTLDAGDLDATTDGARPQDDAQIREDAWLSDGALSPDRGLPTDAGREDAGWAPSAECVAYARNLVACTIEQCPEAEQIQAGFENQLAIGCQGLVWEDWLTEDDVWRVANAECPAIDRYVQDIIDVHSESGEPGALQDLCTNGLPVPLATCEAACDSDILPSSCTRGSTY